MLATGIRHVYRISSAVFTPGSSYSRSDLERLSSREYDCACAGHSVYNNGLRAYTAHEFPSPDRLVDLPRFARAVWTSYDTKGIVARRLVATVACLTLRGRMSAKKATGEVRAFHCFRYCLKEPHPMMHHNDEHSGTLGHQLRGENWGHRQGDYDRRLVTRDYHGEVCDMSFSNSVRKAGNILHGCPSCVLSAR